MLEVHLKYKFILFKELYYIKELQDPIYFDPNP